MKNPVLKIAIVVAVSVGVLTGCGLLKKLLDAKVEQFNEDSNTYKAELDQVDNDINDALSDIEGFGKTDYGVEAYSSPLCGVTIDTSEVANNIVYFNFDGVTPCFQPSRTRAGQIKVELINGSSWAAAGAVLRQTFTDFKVTHLASGRSIEFDGVKTLENVNGHGDWVGFWSGNTDYTYRSKSNDMQVTFDNGASAEWNHARIFSWGFSPQGADPDIPYAYFRFDSNGDTTLNGTANVDSWGVNRFGDDFVTYYTQPITSNTYCGLWRFNSGELVHEVAGDDYTLTLGVDQNGNLATTNCAYGFKVSWNVGNNSNSQVFSY